MNSIRALLETPGARISTDREEVTARTPSWLALRCPWTFRHHWLAKRPDEPAVFAFAAPEDLALCTKTLNLLPKGIPTLTAKIDQATGARELQALMIGFALTSRFGKTRGIDPGRPSVPEFGRKLYHLKVPRQKGPQLADVAI